MGIGAENGAKAGRGNGGSTSARYEPLVGSNEPDNDIPREVLFEVFRWFEGPLTRSTGIPGDA